MEGDFPEHANREIDRQLMETRKKTNMLLVFGIFHMVWSLVILSLGGIIIGEFVKSDLNKHATPIWCSFIFLITGILSTIVFCLPKNKLLIMVHNVFAILSIFFAIAVIIAGGFGADHYNCKRFDFNKNNSTYPTYPRRNLILWVPLECNQSSDRQMAQPVYICLIVFGLLELAGAIISTIYSFRLYNCFTEGCGVCCYCCRECCMECQQTDQLQHTQAYQLQPFGSNNLRLVAQQPQLIPTNLGTYQQFHNEPEINNPTQLVSQQGQIPTTIIGQQNQNPTQLVGQQTQHAIPTVLQQSQIPTQAIMQQTQIVTNAYGQQFFLIPLQSMQQQYIIPTQLQQQQLVNNINPQVAFVPRQPMNLTPVNPLFTHQHPTNIVPTQSANICTTDQQANNIVPTKQEETVIENPQASVIQSQQQETGKQEEQLEKQQKREKRHQKRHHRKHKEKQHEKQHEGEQEEKVEQHKEEEQHEEEEDEIEEGEEDENEQPEQ